MSSGSRRTHVARSGCVRLRGTSQAHICIPISRQSQRLQLKTPVLRAGVLRMLGLSQGYKETVHRPD
eukprot:5123876-Alexandrium_andersonii.AAC.1